MSEETISLQTMLDALYNVKNKKVKKRLIFDQSKLGGIGSKWVKIFFLSLPIILYIGIFNPKIFSMLGIAQAVIFYIVFLSMTMIMVAGLTFINNNKVIRQIESSWSRIFPDVELKQVLASNSTPYKDFLVHYSALLDEGVTDETLQYKLHERFVQMQNENKELYEQLNRQSVHHEK